MSTIERLLETLWEDWRVWSPQADPVRALLERRGEPFINDHIALRTFDRPGLTIDVLARPFVEAGYRPGGEYRFVAKKLFARHWEPPRPELPRLFCSQLLTAELSPAANARIDALVEQLEGLAVLPSRPWKATRADWEALQAESEYAAWLCAFGLRVNHFTVSVNALESFQDLKALNAFLTDAGLALNTAGGTIKGSPEVYLEQSSTQASSIEVSLADGVLSLPGCYVEFALRHPLPNGQLFSGFVASSADRIFESTDLR